MNRFFIYLTLFLSSCNPNSHSHEAKSNQVDSNLLELVDSQKSAITYSKSDLSGPKLEVRELVALQIYDSTSNDVFKKFGVDFSGNCYGCDVIDISVNADIYTFTNACDKDATFDLKIVKLAGDKNKLVEFAGLVLNFTEVVPDLVYKLEVQKNELSKNPQIYRFGEFYTLKDSLNRFENHDCGDFEG